MALSDVKNFYALLAEDKALAEEASAYQKRYSRQEDVIAAFIQLGASRGFLFTENELITWIFEHGTEVKS